MVNHLDLIDPINLRSRDTKSGRWYTTPNGMSYPSITTILGAEEKPGILQWKESVGPKYAAAEMSRAAARGSAVHHMIEQMLYNSEDPTKGQQVGHINEYKSVRLLTKNINDVIALETALYSDNMRVAGRVDCIASYNGVPSIIDFKTSTNTKTKSMITDYFLQTTAYALMLQEQYQIDIADIVIIMSVEKGTAMIFKEKIDNYIEPLLHRISNYHKNNRITTK